MLSEKKMKSKRKLNKQKQKEDKFVIQFVRAVKIKIKNYFKRTS